MIDLKSVRTSRSPPLPSVQKRASEKIFASSKTGPTIRDNFSVSRRVIYFVSLFVRAEISRDELDCDT